MCQIQKMQVVRQLFCTIFKKRMTNGNWNPGSAYGQGAVMPRSSFIPTIHTGDSKMSEMVIKYK